MVAKRFVIAFTLLTCMFFQLPGQSLNDEQLRLYTPRRLDVVQPVGDLAIRWRAYEGGVRVRERDFYELVELPDLLARWTTRRRWIAGLVGGGIGVLGVSVAWAASDGLARGPIYLVLGGGFAVGIGMFIAIRTLVSYVDATILADSYNERLRREILGLE